MYKREWHEKSIWRIFGHRFYWVFSWIYRQTDCAEVDTFSTNCCFAFCSICAARAQRFEEKVRQGGWVACTSSDKPTEDARKSRAFLYVCICIYIYTHILKICMYQIWACMHISCMYILWPWSSFRGMNRLESGKYMHAWHTSLLTFSSLRRSSGSVHTSQTKTSRFWRTSQTRRLWPSRRQREQKWRYLTQIQI